MRPSRVGSGGGRNFVGRDRSVRRCPKYHQSGRAILTRPDPRAVIRPVRDPGFYRVRTWVGANARVVLLEFTGVFVRVRGVGMRAFAFRFAQSGGSFRRNSQVERTGHFVLTRASFLCLFAVFFFLREFTWQREAEDSASTGKHIGGRRRDGQRPERASRER